MISPDEPSKEFTKTYLAIISVRSPCYVRTVPISTKNNGIFVEVCAAGSSMSSRDGGGLKKRSCDCLSFSNVFCRRIAWRTQAAVFRLPSRGLTTLAAVFVVGRTARLGSCLPAASPPFAAEIGAMSRFYSCSLKANSLSNHLGGFHANRTSNRPCSGRPAAPRSKARSCASW